MDKRALLLTFAQALQGVSDSAIIEAARRFSGGHISGQSATFAPSVAEFSQEARRIAEIRTAIASTSGRKLYFYRKPRTKLLERNITKEYGRQLVEQGVHPRGSIWCPGPLDGRPDIGDMFGPDPKWKPAVPKPTDEAPVGEAYQPDTEAARIRMGFKMRLLSAAIGMKRVDDVADANREGMDNLMALAQQWGIAIPEELFTKRAA